MVESLSFICRKKLDEERGNPWICECPMCREQKAKVEKNKEEGVLGSKKDLDADYRL